MILNGVNLKGETLSNTNPPNPRRGEVWGVNFNPTIGSEIQKIRPAVVINSDGMRHLSIKLVVPITGWKGHFEGKIWYVRIEPDDTNGLTKNLTVDTMQIRGVDVERFGRKRGRLNVTLMEEITAAIAAIIEYE